MEEVFPIIVGGKLFHHPFTFLMVEIKNLTVEYMDFKLTNKD